MVNNIAIFGGVYNSVIQFKLNHIGIIWRLMLRILMGIIMIITPKKDPKGGIWGPIYGPIAMVL
jgi:hypothetical protein